MAGREYTANVVVSTDYTLLGSESAYNQLTIGTTVTEIKVGAERLVSRTVLFLNAHKDNTGVIYIGLDNQVSNSKWFLMLEPSEKMALKLDSADDVAIYAIASAAGQKVGICEVKQATGV